MRDLRVFVIDLVVVPFLVGVLPSSINKRINNFAHFILPTVIMYVGLQAGEFCESLCNSYYSTRTKSSCSNFS